MKESWIREKLRREWAVYKVLGDRQTITQEYEYYSLERRNNIGRFPQIKHKFDNQGSFLGDLTKTLLSLKSKRQILRQSQYGLCFI